MRRAEAKTGDMDLMEVFDKDVLNFFARRHGTSVERVVRQFLKQCDINNMDDTEYGFALEANEVEILKDYYLRNVHVLSEN